MVHDGTDEWQLIDEDKNHREVNGEKGNEFWFGMVGYTFTGLSYNQSFDLDFCWTEWKEEYIFSGGKITKKKLTERRIWPAEYSKIRPKIKVTLSTAWTMWTHWECSEY